MNWSDWIILALTMLAIVAAGIWQTRSKQSFDQYLRSGNEMGWFTIGMGVMATQASAITFLSAPGLGYESGLRFVQFYFGMPIAVVIISRYFIPIYYKLRVYTAYEYLEQRFDLRVRLFTALLFLIQRGLAAGLTIYAPAIILSTILGWNLNLTILSVGGLVALPKNGRCL
jgi:Na+/proline symporter